MPPIHNAIKYGTDLLRGYSRAVGLGEDEEGTIRLGETLTPVMNLWSLPEWSFLRGEAILGDTIQVAAGAATFNSGAAVVNPAGSGLIVIVDAITFIVAVVTNDMNLQLATEAQIDAAFVNDVTFERMDTRSAHVSGRSFISHGNINSTAVGVNVETARAVPTSLYGRFAFLPVILAPGTGCVALQIDDAAAVRVSFRVRERRAVPGELRG